MNILAEIRDMTVIHAERTGSRPEKIKLGKKQFQRMLDLDRLLMYNIDEETLRNIKEVNQLIVEWTDHESLMVML